MLRYKFVADDIVDVVAVWTGIPPQRLMETEIESILNIGDKLADRVVGQWKAIEAVIEAIPCSRSGLHNSIKLIASLIFLGPKGVGKTELCKALRKFMSDKEDALIRIEM